MIGQQIVGQQGGRFTVIREVGRGGFGVVYLVEDDQKRPYAIKLIAPVLDAAARLSFEQEIKSTIRLEPPKPASSCGLRYVRRGKSAGIVCDKRVLSRWRLPYPRKINRLENDRIRPESGVPQVGEACAINLLCPESLSGGCSSSTSVASLRLCPSPSRRRNKR